MPWPALAGFGLLLLGAVDCDRARQRTAGDGRGRRARGEGGLVSARAAFARRHDRARAAMKRRAFWRCRWRWPPAARSPTRTYARVEPRALDFPRDHGAIRHSAPSGGTSPAGCADAAGRDYGVQVTFFRNRPGIAEANPSAFAPRELVFAHAALADPRHGRLRHDQRAARAGFGLAGTDEASTARLDRRLVAGAGRRPLCRADRRARVRARPRVRADAAAAAAGRRRVLAQGSGRPRRPATTTAGRSSP